MPGAMLLRTVTPGLGSTGRPTFNRLWTLLGPPCINVPGLADQNGLPLGVQIVGRFARDHIALEAALFLEQALVSRRRVLRSRSRGRRHWASFAYRPFVEPLLAGPLADLLKRQFRGAIPRNTCARIHRPETDRCEIEPAAPQHKSHSRRSFRL